MLPHYYEEISMKRILIPILLGLFFFSGTPPVKAQFFDEKVDYESLLKQGLKRNGKMLNLGGKKIGDEGLKFILNHEKIKKVTHLDLRYNEITAEGGKLIAQSKNLQKLKSLELRHNDLGDSGSQALAESENLPKLQNLKLGWNEVHDPGGLAIAHSKTLTKTLKKLDLRENFLADSTKEELKKAYAHIKSLKLF